MSDLLINMTPLEKASHVQRMAADPSGTRLAAANAGSGKTRVLVDRVSRILLGGTEPQDILCLTYTKAAASEMQERLFSTLGGWSVLDDAALRKDLTSLFGQPPEALTPPVKLSKARELFAKALETPEGLKVQTIHAFCERILSRFPIEAGILPGFEPLEALAAALRILTLERADASLEDLFKWMANQPQKISEWEKLGLDALAQSLELDKTRDPDEIAKGFWRKISPDTLKNAIESLSSSKGKRLPSNWLPREPPSWGEPFLKGTRRFIKLRVKPSVRVIFML